MRHVIGGSAKHRQAALASQMAQFGTEMLPDGESLDALRDMSGR